MELQDLGLGRLPQVKASNNICDIYEHCKNYSIYSTANFPICSLLDKFGSKSPSDLQAKHGVPLNCQKGDGFIKYSCIKLLDTQ